MVNIFSFHGAFIVFQLFYEGIFLFYVFIVDLMVIIDNHNIKLNYCVNFRKVCQLKGEGLY